MLRQLLAHGGDAVLSRPGGRLRGLPLHFAAEHGSPATVRALVQAAPQAAAAADSKGLLPLAYALRGGKLESARCLLELGQLPAKAAPLLACLAAVGGTARSLYAVLVSRMALTAQEWARLRGPLPELATALPAVLQRSAVEARALVSLLPVETRRRFGTGALCLVRAQQETGQELPPAIVTRILAATVQ